MKLNLNILKADARKALVALVAAAGELTALGVLHGTAQHYVTVAIAVLTAVGVYAVPNAPAKP